MKNVDGGAITTAVAHGGPTTAAQHDTPQNSGMAIASLCTGIAALVVCLLLSVLIGIIAGIVAIILGAVSKNKISTSEGQLKGGGFATAGIVTGVISIVVAIVSYFVLAAVIASWYN